MTDKAYLTRDADGDGLLDLWEFLNGLSWTDSAGVHARDGDADGDGWSNYQEWQAGSDPFDSASQPDINGLAGFTAATHQVFFAATRFVMSIGDLDGTGAEEIVVGADGNPGSLTNSFSLLSESSAGWTSQPVEVGTFGITSLGIGQPTNCPQRSIFVGCRAVGATGRVLRVYQSAGTWETETVAISTGDVAFVVGVRDTDVLVCLDATNNPPRAVYAVSFTNAAWSLATLDTNSSHRGLATVAYTNATDAHGTHVRLLDAEGIQVGGLTSGPIPEPAATNRMLTSGYSICTGQIRSGADAYSLLYAYLDDTDLTGSIAAGDQFAVSEFLLSGTNWESRTLVGQTLARTPKGAYYGLAAVDYTNGPNDVLFVAEPSGDIGSWLPTGGTGTLERQVFSTQYQGGNWHQLGACDVLNPGEALAGVLVNPSAPSSCSVVLWEPGEELWQAVVLKQTAPVTRILSVPNSGMGLAFVNFKMWDAEGNVAMPLLEYQEPGTTNWHAATVLGIDGTAYVPGVFVLAESTGSVHQALWYAARDVGTALTNNVVLRARASDITLTGEWSEPVYYYVLATADSDGDGMPDDWEMDNAIDPLNPNGINGASGHSDNDGVDNLSEYMADTDPRDGSSYLAVTRISVTNGGMRVEWQGGAWATQYLEGRQDLASTTEQWSVIYTNLPLPTPIANSILDGGATNDTQFYRIRARR